MHWKENIWSNIFFGGKCNCKIEDHYIIMSKSFNDLEQSGGVYSLSEEHIIDNFEYTTKEVVSISYSIQSKKEWEIIQVIKSFDI